MASARLRAASASAQTLTATTIVNTASSTGAVSRFRAQTTSTPASPMSDRRGGRVRANTQSQQRGERDHELGDQDVVQQLATEHDGGDELRTLPAPPERNREQRSQREAGDQGRRRIGEEVEGDEPVPQADRPGKREIDDPAQPGRHETGAAGHEGAPGVAVTVYGAQPYDRSNRQASGAGSVAASS